MALVSKSNEVADLVQCKSSVGLYPCSIKENSKNHYKYINPTTIVGVQMLKINIL